MSRGGARKGAGRKSTVTEKRIPIGLKLRKSVYDEFKAKLTDKGVADTIEEMMIHYKGC